MLLAPLMKYALGGLAFVTLLMGLGLMMERRHSAKLKTQLHAVTELRAADRRAYESAQKLAGEQNRAHVARIEAEQERISADATQTLSARLERLRRELRANTATAGSAAGGAGSPANGETAGGADGAARLCPAPDQLLRGAENEERHDQLITWVERQSGVVR